MHDQRRVEYRARGVQLVTLLVLISFAFIPVRCDASAAPHSIFTDPVSTDSGHDMDAMASEASTGMTMHHQHHAGMNMTSSSTAMAKSSPMQDICAISLTNGADPESQQPVGATLDLPTTTVLSAATILPPLDGAPIVHVVAPEAELTGIAAPPDAPPPKSI